MIVFHGLYYDGQTSKAHQVVVHTDQSDIDIQGEGIDLRFPIESAEILTNVGSARNIIRLGQSGEIHTEDTDALEGLLSLIHKRSPETLARFLEQKALYALAALLLTVALIGAFLRYALPEMALYAAAALPPSVDANLGKEALRGMDEFYLSPSCLSNQQQESIKSALNTACLNNNCPPVTLLFRQSKALGANAFALPNRTVVITDELVLKAHNTDEITSVLLHEYGHVHYNHIERMLLQSLGSGLILVMITGDIGNFSDLAAGLPAILLQQGYSRDMEDEADRFALNALHSANINPKHFADILLRITKETSNGGSFFSSHPDTQERIRPFLLGDK